MIQAILFDCDGVIADSEALWNQIDAVHLAAFGVPDYDGHYKDQVIGKGFTLSSGFYRDVFALEAPLEELIAHRTEIAARFYAESVPIFRSVPEVLAQVQEMGLKIALATSSVSRLITPFLRRHDIEKWFDVIITGEMVKNGKPHPDIYLLAAQKCGVDPRHCVVVEDALAGLEAGRGAGAITIVIPDARWMDVALFAGQADYQVAELPEILPLVRSLLQSEAPKA